MECDMRVKFIKNWRVALDGINLTIYNEGNEVCVDSNFTKYHADLAVSLGVAEAIQNPVVEQKVVAPTEKKRGRKKKGE
jgi:hypothetical protein